MSDLISREDAVALVIKAIHGTDNKEIQEYLFDGLRKQMWSLPSAESTGAMDEAIQEYIKDGYMQPIGEDLISRQDAVNEIHKYFVEEIDKTPTEIDEDGDELYADMPTVNSLLACNKELSKRIKSLSSAPDSRQRGEWVEENEEDYDYERAIDQMEHDILYEPTYNPEDGSM